MKKRRGITPILAVILLVGIALVGGVFLNGISQNFFATSMSALKYTVNDLRVEKDSNNICFLSASLYNSGSLPIKKTTVKTTLDNGDDWSHADLNGTTVFLEPKDQLDKILKFDGSVCGNFTVGNTYSMFVNASSDESSFATIVPVKIGSVGGT